MLKPSELAPHTADVIEKVITEAFPAHYVAMVQGGPDVAQALLARHWDRIFFTGSTAVGLIVARAAAEHLTPVTLELGGKSSEDYARIVNQRHFDRLSHLLGAGRVAAGAETDRDHLYIAPTILEGVSLDAPVMQEEIFDPILPVLEFATLDAAIATVRRFPRPLPLCLFTGDRTASLRFALRLTIVASFLARWGISRGHSWGFWHLYFESRRTW